MSKLLDHMNGKEVIVITNAVQRMFNAGQQIESSVHHKGLLLDEDDEFVYLGSDFDTISALVSKKTIVSIVDSEIMEEQENLQEILNSIPSDPNKIN